MDVTKLIQTVEEDSSFKEYMTNNSDSFLAHVFMMSDGDSLRDVQVGYYNPENKKMTSFAVANEKVERMPEQDVFQKPGQNVSPLEIFKVKASYDDVKAGVEKLVKEKYASEGNKKIFILQNLTMGQVWNVTYLTTKFSTINIKISSEDLEIVSDEEVQIIDFNRSR